MKAAIYARISADREGAGLGVQTQEADCRDLAERLGWPIEVVYVDNDLSAYSGKRRPGYEALLADLRAGRVSGVLCWHPDRLHRSPAELERFIETCETAGATVQTVKAGNVDLATPSGRMVARLLGVTARHEVEHAIERMQRAKLRSAEAGKWKGGRRPFGYADDGVTTVDREADAIASATAAILGGSSVLGITREWNGAELTTATGKPWTATAVRRTLLRPRNAGLMEHRGEVVGRAEWPAIVAEETWHAVVRILTDPSRRTTPGGARRWLGSGLYLCSVCGSPTVASQSNGRTSYRCTNGGHVSRNAAAVDSYVGAVIAERLRRPDFRDALAVTEGIDTGALELRAVALRGRLDGLAAMYAAEAIDSQQLTQGSKDLRAELEQVRSRLAEAFSGSTLEGIANAPDPGTAWLDAPLDRRRAVIETLATITLVKGPTGRPKGWAPGDSYFDPEHVRIEWRAA